MANTRSVMLYVQHLLGVGHLNRSLLLAKALQTQGMQVSLVSGGMPQPGLLTEGIDFFQLDPLRSKDASFQVLLNKDGIQIDQQWKNQRSARLLDIFTAIAPDALITETFPFGRRMMRFELLPLLDAAQHSTPRPIVIASIRDILQPKSKPQRNDEIRQLIDYYYHRVLVHGDSKIARLQDSFELADQIVDKIAYSGYICNQVIDEPIVASGSNEVIVSAGGSATGLNILKTALAAKSLCPAPGLNWRLLVSPAISNNDFERLKSSADRNTIVERNRKDFTRLIASAALSISQAGYNTVTDLLQTSTPAIVIPFADAEELEQSIRSARLESSGRALQLKESEMNAQRLAALVQQALRAKPVKLNLDLDGARKSAMLIKQWLQAK